MGKPPVFLFAYANDRSADHRYLRNLPEERRRIARALRDAVGAGTCEVVVCPDATVTEVLDECQRAGDRLALLHFGGHADGESLLFEDAAGFPAAAGAATIAEFLRRQRSLALVVLNGCGTRGHVDALLDGEVRAVVATSTAVKDELATEFAARFYAALAGAATVESAFNQASGATKLQLGAGATVTAALRNVLPPAVLETPSGWPWELAGSDAARGHAPLARRRPAVAPLIVVGALALGGAGFAGYQLWARPDVPSGIDAAAGRTDAATPSVDAALGIERGVAAVDAAPDARIRPRRADAATDDDPAPADELSRALAALRAKAKRPCTVELRVVEPEIFVRCRCNGTLVKEWPLGSKAGTAVVLTGEADAAKEIGELCHAP